MTLALALLMAAAAPEAGHSLKNLEALLLKREAFVEVVNRPAPEFTLRDADGRSVRLADFRGKVVVLWFIYASCPDECPLQSEALAAIQELVNKTPMRELVQFIAVTTDPERDLPEILKAYGPAHGLDPVNWVFLTSGADKPMATRELAERGYGLKFTPTDDGLLMHGVVTHLIDKSGNLRARYHGLKFDPTNFILHVNAFTHD
ncbi:MAG: SCO family protein [Pseudomonadota bacterium]